MSDLAVIILFLCSGFCLVFLGYLNIRQREGLRKALGQNAAKRFQKPNILALKIRDITRLTKSAVYRNWSLIGQSISIGIAMIGGGFFLKNEIPLALVLLVVAALLCLSIVLVNKRQTQKQELFVKQLPEAIEIIVRGARVGLTIEHSFKLVGEEMPAPAGPIFRTMAEKQQLGQDLQSLLVSMSDKIDVKEFHFLAVTLILQQQSGGQYSTILQNLSSVLRSRQTHQKRLHTLTSEARLSAKAIALITACLVSLIALTNDAQIDFLVNEGSGRSLLLYSAASILLGFILISVLLRSMKE